MSTVDCTIEDLPKLLTQASGKRKAAIEAAIKEAILLGAELLAKEAPKAFGHLQQSFHAETNMIVADAPHAGLVELGTRAHRPPLAPLLAWAERIGASDPRALAIAVQRKIEEHGSEPTHFVRSNLDKLVDALKHLVETALAFSH